MMNLRSSGNKDKDMTHELDEIRQMNKRNHQLQHQKEEEEAKLQQDEEAGNRHGDDPMDPALPAEGTIPNFTSEVHNIMNGVQDMETSDTEKGVDANLRSPVKKRQGSSKSSSRRNAGTRQVSPSEVGQAEASTT